MEMVPKVQIEAAEVASALHVRPTQEQLTALTGSSSCPEVQLLLACARTTINTETAERIKSLLNGPIHWTYLLEKAHKHFVMPLLYRSLESTAPELVPDEVLESLRGSFRRNALNNLFRTREMLLVLQILESKGIPALPFKGPVLAASIYGDLGLRQFGDLDILVQRSHLTKVKELLFSRGYRFAIPASWMEQKFPILSRRKDFIFISQDQQTLIELHWRLSGKHFPIPFDMRRLWEQLEPIPLAGSRVRSLPSDELLLYLCVHGSRHSWERLAWICDISEMLRSRESIDLTRLMKRASKLGVERTLTLGLYLAHELLEARIPESLLARILSEPEIISVAARIRGLLFQDDRTTYDDIGYWYHHHLTVRERSSDRLKLHLHYLRRYFHLAVTPNAKDRELFTLPRSLSFLRYFLRPVRLVRRLTQQAIHKRSKNVLYSIIRPFRPPKPIWSRLAFQGSFRVQLPSGESFLLNNAGTAENRIFWQGVTHYEPHGLREWARMCRTAKVILDVGANYGIYSLVAKAVNPKAQVIAFEPVPESFARLQANAALNNFDIHCERVAVGDCEAFTRVYYDPRCTDQATLTSNDGHRNMSVPVQSLRLDRFLEQRGITVDLMKIDVEGHEPDVLRGLGQHRPSAIFVEVLDDRAGREVADLAEDYKFFRLDKFLTPVEHLHRSRNVRDFLLIR